MQLRFFHIPANDSSETEAELNAFLRSVRPLSVETQMTRAASAPSWAIAVEYLEKSPRGGNAGKRTPREKVDYKETLSEDDFLVFSQLRELRKSIAEEEAVPVYAVLTNDQLAKIVTTKAGSLSEIGAIPGIGEARVKKYGRRFIDALQTHSGEAQKK